METYTAISLKPEKTILVEIEACKNKITKYENELSRRAKFTANQRLADRLKPLLRDYQDEYYYSDWDTPGGYGKARKRVLDLVDALVKQFEVFGAEAIIATLEMHK